MPSSTPTNPAEKPDAKTSSLGSDALRNLAQSPFKTLSITVAMLGGLLLLMFLADIGFLPDLDLAGATSMLYAVALLGLLLVLAMAGLLVVPALMMRGVRTMVGVAEDPVRFAPVVHTGYPAEPMPPRKRNSPWIELVPWVVACAVWLATLTLWVSDSNQRVMRGVVTFGAVICILASVGWALWHAFRETARGGPERRLWIAGRMAGESILATFFFGMPVFVIVQLMALGEMRHEPVSWPLLLTLALLLICSSVTAWVLATPHPDIGFGFGLAFALALLALVAAQTRSVTVIPHAIVRKLGLGDIEFARAGVTATGCRQINAVLGDGACPDSLGPDAVAPLCPIRIRSRVGQQLVLEFGEVAWKAQKDGTGLAAIWADEKAMRRVVLDKSQLPSWQPLHTVVDAVEPPAAGASSIPVVTLWRKSGVDAGERLKRLCDARIEPALPAPTPMPAAISASSPASGSLPPKAPRG